MDFGLTQNLVQQQTAIDHRTIIGFQAGEDLDPALTLSSQFDFLPTKRSGRGFNEDIIAVAIQKHCIVIHADGLDIQTGFDRNQLLGSKLAFVVINSRPGSNESGGRIQTVPEVFEHAAIGGLWFVRQVDNKLLAFPKANGIRFRQV